MADFMSLICLSLGRCWSIWGKRAFSFLFLSRKKKEASHHLLIFSPVISSSRQNSGIPSPSLCIVVFTLKRSARRSISSSLHLLAPSRIWKGNPYERQLEVFCPFLFPLTTPGQRGGFPKVISSGLFRDFGREVQLGSHPAKRKRIKKSEA